MLFTKEYQELIRQRMSSAFSAFPLVAAWEFRQKRFDKSSYWEKDLAFLQSMSLHRNWQLPFDLHMALDQGNKAIVVTDIAQSIVFVSSHFEQMTGYLREEAIGRKPSFLQGKETDRDTRSLIREALNTPRSIKTQVVNYRKNGFAYHCDVEIYPIFDTQQKQVNFIAIEREV